MQVIKSFLKCMIDPSAAAKEQNIAYDVFAILVFTFDFNSFAILLFANMRDRVSDVEALANIILALIVTTVAVAYYLKKQGGSALSPLRVALSLYVWQVGGRLLGVLLSFIIPLSSIGLTFVRGDELNVFTALIAIGFSIGFSYRLFKST
jgi:hypothetical protein